MNAISAYLTTLVFVAQQRLGKATKGATAVEYGLLVALIAGRHHRRGDHLGHHNPGHLPEYRR
jgi:hypothetical protein